MFNLVTLTLSLTISIIFLSIIPSPAKVVWVLDKLHDCGVDIISFSQSVSVYLSTSTRKQKNLNRNRVVNNCSTVQRETTKEQDAHRIIAIIYFKQL